MYAALKYPAISNIIQVEEIEQEIADACHKPNSETAYPPPPAGVSVALTEATNSVIATWLIERINIDIDLLTSQIIETTEKRDELYQSLNDIEVWLKERHKVILVRQHGIRTNLNPHLLFADIKATYESAAARFINPTRQGAPQPPNEISPENVIGSFYLYVKQIKEMMEAPVNEEPMTGPTSDTTSVHISPPETTTRVIAEAPPSSPTRADTNPQSPGSVYQLKTPPTPVDDTFPQH